jgi:NADPH:quinone reductase
MAGCVSFAGFSKAFRNNITIHTYFLERERYKMDALRILAERGQLKPLIDSVMPLSDVADAHRRLAAGGVRGKIVLSVEGA